MPTFQTVILSARTNATGVEVPAEVIDELGAGKRPAVVITIRAYSYRSTVGVMGGKSLIPLSSDHRRASGLSAGDQVEVTVVLDTEPREVVPPADFEALLTQDPAARAAFDALSVSRKRALVDPVEQAKGEETRRRRLEKAFEALRG